MKPYTFFFLTLLISFYSVCAQKRITQDPAFKQGEILVQLHQKHSFKEIEEEFLSLSFEDYRLISSPTNIWVVNFDPNEYFNSQVIKRLKSSKLVQFAQNNHFVELRSSNLEMIDDPLYNNQWHHNNTGQTGGTPGADISSEAAWQVTTGGQTVLGDDIVVCVIESADLSHEDLVANRWLNTSESQVADGVDTDDNGYIDDFFGWNIAQNNDFTNMAPSSHGTSVAGMIGAVGNNNLGVVGANWDVKIMVVAGHSTLESDVIEAYTYPLTQRQIYNTTNGTQGAFVVATNASWGVDGGNPEDAPIWCNFYDILGQEGILNCGATTNNNANVDLTGDLPTACSSEFMIGVGRSDHNDDFAGGYGLTTVDLVAPGINVVTTSNGDIYTTTTGTSFASPLTAGVIGLLYSVPCPSLLAIAKSNPQLGASIVKDALLLNVDQQPQLENFFITGGRLNTAAAIDYLMDNYCSDDACFPAFNLTINELTDTQVTLSWLELDEEDEYQVHYRVAGEEDWTIIDVVEAEASIDNLQACEDYQYFVRSFCEDLDEDETTDFIDSDIELFTTDGCCKSPEISTIEVVNNENIQIEWEAILAAESYTLRYRLLSEEESAEEDWVLIETIEDEFLILDNLVDCEDYEIQIQTICQGETTSFSDAITFTSTGCAVCFSTAYCSSFATDDQDEWIESFSINSIVNVSGNNGGYENFEDNLSIELQPGETYPIELTPGFGEGEFDQYFRVWIDFNQNEEFEDNELVYDSGNPTTSTVLAEIAVPEDAVFGLTRMRVSMKYFSEGFFPSPPPEACEEFEFGEVEDYCVTINGDCNIPFQAEIEDAGCSSDLGSITLDFEESVQDYVEVNWEHGATGTQINDLIPGTYVATILNQNNACEEVRTFEIEEIISEASFDFDIDQAVVNFTNTSTAEGQANFEWDFGDGVTSEEENPEKIYLATGTYNVCLTMTDDCGTKEECKEIIIESLSINDFTTSKKLSVYPNPASNELNFSSSIEPISDIKIFDVHGKLVENKTPNELNFTTSVSHLSNGVYFYICSDTNNQIIAIGKVIIDK